MTNPAAARDSSFTRAATGGPRLLLRLEAAAIAVAAVASYRQLGGSWGLFAALFLTPDLSMLAYLAGPRAGALAYNTAHTYLLAAGLAALGLALGAPVALQLAAISAAHVGFDRALGYGLKYATAFADTHLGRVGRRLERRAA